MKKMANVDQSRCVACGVCAKVCARSAVAVWRGCYAMVDEGKCAGCGMCAKACPAGCIAMYRSYMASEPERMIDFSMDRDGVVHMGGESA